MSSERSAFTNAGNKRRSSPRKLSETPGRRRRRYWGLKKGRETCILFCFEMWIQSVGASRGSGMPRVQYHNEMEQFVTYRPYNYSQPSVLQRLGLEPQFISATAVHIQQQLQYLRYAEPLELTACPLDLSVKSQAPITPPCTPSPGSKRQAATPPTVPDQPPKKQKPPTPNATKKTKATRKLNFDEDNSSPVSGTIIRELGPDETLVVRKGDIDPAFNVVEVTEEAKAELAKIENNIGDYVCRLCRELYEDAFGLAQHRCSRIVHVEYRCPECDKVFNCPANLASHRRWHKPRPAKEIKTEENDAESGEQFPCGECGKKFRRIAYLRKHQAVHQVDWQRLIPIRPIPRMPPRLWRPPPLPQPTANNSLLTDGYVSNVTWLGHFWSL